MGLLPSLQPLPCLLQRSDQRRTTARSQRLQPWLQGYRGLQAVTLPLRCPPTGGQQGQPSALPVCLVEQRRQQAFGLSQCLMAAG
ncbi:hypothetical protein D3C81_1906700 [compost metagenome]